MVLRFPLQVRRAPDLDAQAAAWETAAGKGRGDVSKRAAQRLKELRRLEGLFPRKPFLGRNVPKQLIPKRLKAFGVTNLFRNDLPDGWRLLHTVVELDAQQAVIGLLALPHDEYDDLFGYAS